MTTKVSTPPARKTRRSRAAAAPAPTAPQLLEKLRERVEALGFTFWRTTERNEFDIFVGNPKNGSIVLIDRWDGGAPELESWLDDREAEFDAETARRASAEPADHAVSKALGVAYGVRAVAHVLLDALGMGSPELMTDDDRIGLVTLLARDAGRVVEILEGGGAA